MLRVLTMIMLAGYWAAIFVGTHLPMTLGGLPGVNDKMLHLGAYAGLGFLLSAALTTYGLRRGTLYITLLVGATYGCFDEVTQMFIQGRSTEVTDWAADVLGAGAGAIAFAIALLLITRRFPNAMPQVSESTTLGDAP